MGGHQSIFSGTPSVISIPSVDCTCKASSSKLEDVNVSSPIDVEWERTRALQSLAHLDRNCHRYYSQNLRPLVQRLAWMDLFPERSAAASRSEWERMAREIQRLDRDRRMNNRHCSERDWNALRSVWTRIIHRCPYEDIVRRYESLSGPNNSTERPPHSSPSSSSSTPMTLPPHEADNGHALFPPPPRPRFVRFIDCARDDTDDLTEPPARRQRRRNQLSW